MMNFKRLLNKVTLNKIMFYLGLLSLFLFSERYLRRHPVCRLPEHLNKYLRFNEKYTAETALTQSEVNRLNLKLEKWNDNLQVFNWKRYGPVTSETTIIAIQVHRDVERLQFLIISLAQVSFIQNALLIFSHSYYNEALNALVRNVTFCKVMQIFYPYSLQLHPNKFPKLNSSDYQNTETLNTPQSCIERNNQAMEQKQHWWWMANLIFENMDWSYKYKGVVIFLEEDSYVLPDMLYMLKYAQRSLTHIPGIDVLSFGRPYAKKLDYNLFTVDTWRPPYDKGLAFNKTTWKRILKLSSYFCMYDDFSWSYSLLNLFGKFQRGRAEMLACLSPRVISTRMYPSGRIAMESILNWLHEKNMFPVTVKTVMLYDQQGRVDRNMRTPRGNGGWNDMHDHALCLDPLMATYSEERDEGTTSSPIFT